MSADEPGKPDVAIVVGQTREMLLAGSVSRETALDALREIAKNLEDKLQFTAETLEPIRQLIAEIEDGGLGTGPDVVRQREGPQDVQD
jgi:hypothetical protein